MPARLPPSPPLEMPKLPNKRALKKEMRNFLLTIKAQHTPRGVLETPFPNILPSQESSTHHNPREEIALG
jgi:hypothetical protein